MLCFLFENNYLLRLEQKNIVWAIPDRPKTLDPGLCGSMDGTYIINNTFEGLFRVIKKDEINFGVAKSFEVFEDKKTYKEYLVPQKG